MAKNFRPEDLRGGVNTFYPTEEFEITVYENGIMFHGDMIETSVHEIDRDQMGKLLSVFESIFTTTKLPLVDDVKESIREHDDNVRNKLPLIDDVKESIRKYVNNVRNKLPEVFSNLEPSLDGLPNWIEREFELEEGTLDGNRDYLREVESWVEMEFSSTSRRKSATAYEEYLASAVFADHDMMIFEYYGIKPDMNKFLKERKLRILKEDIKRTVRINLASNLEFHEENSLNNLFDSNKGYLSFKLDGISSKDIPMQETIFTACITAINGWGEGSPCTQLEDPYLLSSLNILTYMWNLTKTSNRLLFFEKILKNRPLPNKSSYSSRRLEELRAWMILLEAGKVEEAQVDKDLVGPEFNLTIEYPILELAEVLIVLVECIRDDKDFLKGEPVIDILRERDNVIEDLLSMEKRSFPYN